jgi:hypothetical protein
MGEGCWRFQSIDLFLGFEKGDRQATALHGRVPVESAPAVAAKKERTSAHGRYGSNSSDKLTSRFPLD